MVVIMTGDFRGRLLLLNEAGPRRHRGGGGHHGALVLGRFQQAGDEAFEAEAVDDHEVGLGDGLGVGRRRLVDVGVAVGTDERVHGDAVAADLGGHVAEHGKAGDHVERFGVGDRRGREERGDESAGADG